jgi:hypothetical protein
MPTPSCKRFVRLKYRLALFRVAIGENYPMTGKNHRSVSIAPGQGKASLSPKQKTFNTLIRQIEKRRRRLGAWEAVTPVFQKKYLDEFLPIEKVCTDLQVKMVYRLEQACSQKGLTKSERSTISQLIVDLAHDLIEERDDAELKAIYNKHSHSDYDSKVTIELEEMKSILEAMFSTELGDDIDMNSPEDLLQHVQAKVEEQYAQEAAEDQAREERRAKRKKSAKQLAAQARQEAQQAQLSQSIREVYRKLASALHPDREADPQERQRKTELMQQANQAYGKNNLLQLLELQLELEHIDQNAINTINADRLQHYNTILKEQLGELDQEILHVEVGFRHVYGIPPFIDIAPDTVVRTLASNITAIRRSARNLEEDLVALEELRTLKSWLKSIKHQHTALRFDEIPF